MIVPERSATVRRYRIPHRYVMGAVLGGIGVFALAVFLCIHYLFIVDQARENRVLKDRNVDLQARLAALQREIARIDGDVQRIDQLASKVRAITQLSDPERNLAIGPVSEQPGSVPAVQFAPGESADGSELLDSEFALRMADNKVDGLSQDVLQQEREVRELHDYFREHELLLSNTPSIRPVHSKLLSSKFGPRVDPYTGKEEMHVGLDFAAEHGSEVRAPADGVVIFAGQRGKYGKLLVLDHGFGLQTHYGHLSAFDVAVGEPVERGQVIGAVGKTGRTTGVHLHYEVRLDGIPQDPERFILDGLR